MKQLLNYYAQCIREEAKFSAFTNISKDNKAEIVKLHGKEVLISSENHSAFFPNHQADLINLKCNSDVDKEKELIYGYMFLTGKYNNRAVYTPLFYSFARIDITGGQAIVSINPDVQLNVGTLMSLVDNVDVIAPLTTMFLSEKPTPDVVLPLIKSTFECIDTDGSNIEAPLRLSRDKAVILTKAPQDTAGLIQDFKEMALANDYKDTALRELERVYQDLPTTPVESSVDVSCFVNTLTKSQEQAASAAEDNVVTSVLGAPGTGKTHLIATIANDYIANGKTVLIASKMDGALEVIRSKMLFANDELYPHVLITGDKLRRAEVSKFMNCFVNGVVKKGSYYTPWDKEKLSERVALEQDAEDYRSLIRHDEDKRDNAEGIFAPVVKFFRQRAVDISTSSLLATGKKLKNMPLYIDLARSVLGREIKSRFENVETDNDLRQTVLRLSRTIVKGDIRTNSYKNDFEKILNNFIPCWLTTNNYVSASIPNVAGLFDLVIIDEASQCDIASSLPLLYRAKKAVIVGDNNQLKFITFMSAAKNKSFQAQCEVKEGHVFALDYRENSLYDFATYISSHAPYVLTEQFRGNKTIMGFSDRKFYGDKVVNMNPKNPDSLKGVRVDGRCWADKTANDDEAKAIMKEIKNAIAENNDLTFGIISPFKAQVDLIKKYIDRFFTTEEVEKHKIRVGTAHAFQGDERDVMLLSWAVDRNSHRQSFAFIDNPNLFNVAITRAKHVCINYFSLGTIDMPNGLLKEYAEGILNK